MVMKSVYWYPTRNNDPPNDPAPLYDNWLPHIAEKTN